MIVQILLASSLLLNGNTLQLYDDSANCPYPSKRGVIVDSTNIPIVQLCWRVSAERGTVVTSYSANMKVEDFDWTASGWKYVRRVVR